MQTSESSIRDVHDQEKKLEIASSLFLFLIMAVNLTIIILSSGYKKPPPAKTLFMGLPGDDVSHLTLGFHLPGADFLWLRVIQDFTYKDPNILNYGWSFHLMDAATILDPRFRMIYVMGAPILSQINDNLGAKDLFDRGMKNYPYDWNIWFRAGYHYLYKLHDCHEAGRIFKQALDDGAPIWLSSLVGRLYSTSGQYDLAKAVVLDQLKALQDNPRAVAILTERLKEIENQASNKLTVGVMNDCLDKSSAKPPAR